MTKQSVAFSSILASLFMTVVKLVVGLMTGSLGLLAEAAHSLLDLGAATLTWFAVRIGDQPADQQHPYGHGKVESISALIETGLLFLTSAWIVKEAIGRLMADHVEVETTWYGVAVIVVCIAIDFHRARALSKVAKETHSHALEADALHFSSDIYSSLVVLAGLGMVAFGWAKADAIAAIGVALFVCIAGWRLGKRTIDVLIDTQPQGLVDEVEAIITHVPDVARVDMVRARPVGATVFVEVVVKVSRGLAFERVQDVRDRVAEAICRAKPEARPLVVAEPLTLDDESVAETVRIAAAHHGLSVHDIGIHTIHDRRHVGFDLEVDDHLTIRQAHDIASRLEEKLAAELGDDVAIDIHIDPRRHRVTDGRDVVGERRRALEAEVEAVVASHPLVYGVHRLFAQEGSDGLYIAFHCLFPDEAPIREVHDVTAQVEHDLRQRLEGVARVVVHAEPEDHVDHALAARAEAED